MQNPACPPFVLTCDHCEGNPVYKYESGAWTLIEACDCMDTPTEPAHTGVEGEYACGTCEGGGIDLCDCTGVPTTLYFRKQSDDSLLNTLVYDASPGPLSGLASWRDSTHEIRCETSMGNSLWVLYEIDFMNARAEDDDLVPHACSGTMGTWSGVGLVAYSGIPCYLSDS